MGTRISGSSGSGVSRKFRSISSGSARKFPGNFRQDFPDPWIRMYPCLSTMFFLQRCEQTFFKKCLFSKSNGIKIYYLIFSTDSVQLRTKSGKMVPKIVYSMRVSNEASFLEFCQKVSKF